MRRCICSYDRWIIFRTTSLTFFRPSAFITFNGFPRTSRTSRPIRNSTGVGFCIRYEKGHHYVTMKPRYLLSGTTPSTIVITRECVCVHPFFREKFVHLIEDVSAGEFCFLDHFDCPSKEFYINFMTAWTFSVLNDGTFVGFYGWLHVVHLCHPNLHRNYTRNSSFFTETFESLLWCFLVSVLDINSAIRYWHIHYISADFVVEYHSTREIWNYNLPILSPSKSRSLTSLALACMKPDYVIEVPYISRDRQYVTRISNIIFVFELCTKLLK